MGGDVGFEIFLLGKVYRGDKELRLMNTIHAQNNTINKNNIKHEVV